MATGSDRVLLALALVFLACSACVKDNADNRRSTDHDSDSGSTSQDSSDTLQPAPAERPFVLFTAEEVRRVTSLVENRTQGTLGYSSAEIGEELRAYWANRPINAEMFPGQEPAEFWNQKRATTELETAVKAAALLRYIFGDDKHVPAAKQMMLKAARWDRWSERDLPAAAALRALALGLDWFYEDFTDSERQTLQSAMIRLGVSRILGYHDACQQNPSRGNPMCDGASPNHMASNASALGFAALVLPSQPEAKSWLEIAIDRMRHSLAASGGADGGAVEGFSYGAVEVLFAKDFISALQARGVDLSQAPWLKAFPYYVAYSRGPDVQYVNFNDANIEPPGCLGSVLLWIASQFPSDSGGQLAQTLVRDMLPTFLGPLALLDLDNQVAPLALADLPRARVFPSVGQLFARSDWSDAALLFASRSQGPGPDGNHAHTHYDAGHFVLNWAGEHLLADPGYAMQYFLQGQIPDPGGACPGVPFEYLNEFTLRASGHNTVVFDGAITQTTLSSQLVRVDLSEPDSPTFFVEMEFGDAYRRIGDPDTRLFGTVRRRILASLPFAILIHDHARSVDPTQHHQMQVLFHSRWRGEKQLGPEPEISVNENENEARITLVDGSRQLRVLSLGSSPTAVTKTVHPFVPCAGAFVVGKTQPASQLDAFHLLVPVPTDDEPIVEDVSVSGEFVGAKVTLGDDSVTLLLSADGKERTFAGFGRDGSTGVGLITWDNENSGHFLVPRP